jgi:hypothetical protein
MFKKLKIAKLFSRLSVIFLIINTSSVWASWDWITETAIGQFTAEDIEMLKATGRDALDNQPDNAVVHWNNPETGNSGSIKITNTRELDGMKCRSALLKNRTKLIDGNVRYLLCQYEDSTWKITFEPNE